MSSTLARPLGRIERFYWLYDQHACTNFVLAAVLDDSVTRGAVRAALGRLWERHPLLRCAIAVDERAQPVLQPDAGPAPELPRAPMGTRWQDLAALELLRAFAPQSHPLLRFAWVPATAGVALVATFNHGLLDARAAGALLCELLADAVGCPPTGEPAPDAAPCERHYPARHRGPLALLRFFWVSFLDGIERLRVGTPLGLPDAPPLGTPRDLLALVLALDEQQTRALVQRCREQDCTVQGALCAAQLLALRSIFPQDGTVPSSTSTAADLRPLLEPPLPAETLGVHVSLIPTYHRVDNHTAPWRLAREVVQGVKRKLARGHGQLFWLAIPPATLLPPDARGAGRLARLARHAPVSTVVTNLGRLPPLPARSRDAVRSLHFLMAPQEGAALCTGALSLHGALRLVLVFDRSHLDEQRAHQVAARFRQVLEGLIAPAPAP